MREGVETAERKGESEYFARIRASKLRMKMFGGERESGRAERTEKNIELNKRKMEWKVKEGQRKGKKENQEKAKKEGTK